jgi:predicted metal-dependent hydrolase
LTIEDSNEATRGQVYDLDAIFQRVNAQYFQGQLERPRLTWNQTLTHHKFGHYQPTTDTLMVSITLDHPEIPIYLLEFVMYHELLHKALGLKISNGRRYAHHKDFLEAEARFQHYTEAKEWLSRLGDRGSRQ